jgi:hypothetical protein
MAPDQISKSTFSGMKGSDAVWSMRILNFSDPLLSRCFILAGDVDVNLSYVSKE